MKKYRIFLNGVQIGYEYYEEGLSLWQVRQSLIQNDGYDSRIDVRE